MSDRKLGMHPALGAPYDIEKPELKKGEVLCGGCWTVGAMQAPVGWIFMNYKHLAPTWLCPKCQGEYKENFEKLQKAGL